LHLFSKPFPLKGGITLRDRIFPGPMEGILEPVFCKILVRKKLVHTWITPYFRVTTGVPNLSTMKKFLEIFDCDKMPVIVQLMGKDIELIAKTAFFINENFNIAGINLNFACPSKTVCSKGAGGALLKDPSKMRIILNRIRDLCPNLSLSVKIRMAYENPDDISAIANELQQSEVDFVFIHFRTVSEAYKKVQNRTGRFELAKKAFDKTPLFLSGDILSLDDAIELGQSKFGDGLVIARGLIKTPWLIDDVRTYYNEETVIGVTSNRAIDFFCDMLELACEDNLCWNKHYFAEIGRYLFGVKSELFSEYKRVCHQDPQGILKYFKNELN
jgi:tRNA-dihydrouridine synthase